MQGRIQGVRRMFLPVLPVVLVLMDLRVVQVVKIDPEVYMNTVNVMEIVLGVL